MNLNSSSSALQYFNVYFCFTIRPPAFILIFTTFTITTILLLLPLCMFILYLDLKQWQKKRVVSTAANISHSDVCTYHMVVMDLIGISGSIILCCSTFTRKWRITLMGSVLFSFNWYGQAVFHVLTCVDRYLAVVHPITYLGMKKGSWIRRRNIIIGCVWLLSVGGAVLYTDDNLSIFIDFCFLVFPVIVISFCSVSVLCVLVRPGPGEAGGDRKRANQFKKKAFITITTILGALSLRFAFTGIWLIMFFSAPEINLENCLIGATDIFCSLPASLVVPLLFLHRTLKLQCRKNTD